MNHNGGGLMQRTQAMTDQTPVSFTIKEGPQGEPTEMIEEGNPGLPVLREGDAFLMLQFRPGVSFEQAERFTSEMRRMFDVLSYNQVH